MLLFYSYAIQPSEQVRDKSRLLMISNRPKLRRWHLHLSAYFWLQRPSHRCWLAGYWLSIWCSQTSFGDYSSCRFAAFRNFRNDKAGGLWGCLGRDSPLSPHAIRSDERPTAGSFTVFPRPLQYRSKRLPNQDWRVCHVYD